MIKLKALLNNKWFFPVVMFYYGVFYILFGEVYHKLWSADGRVYEDFVWDLTNSFYFDTYYVYRILPSLLVSFIFKLFSIEQTGEHIVTAFQILNLSSIIIACCFLKQILILLKISLKNQLLSFALFLINFGVIKYPFYLPVMTDTVALMLSTVLLYFYLKNNTTGIIISTLLLAFTWPMAYYQGLLLIAFPICMLPAIRPLKWQKILIYGISVFYILVFIIYLIVIKKTDITLEYVAKIDRSLLPVSILGILLLYFFFAKPFLNKTLFDISLFFKKINYKRLLLSIGVFATVSIIIHFLHPKPTSLYSTAQILTDTILFALIKPLFSIVADISYLGIVICLLIIFWSSFCKIVSQMGWGLVAAFALNLFLFGITPQSRHLINILPWIIIFLAKAINKYSFSNNFYIVIGLMCVVGSKIWLLINNKIGYPPMRLDKNGSMGFPIQKLWMNIGPWMSEQMYFVQGGVVLLFIGILFFMLYKVEVDESNRLQFVPKYKILK